MMPGFLVFFLGGGEGGEGGGGGVIWGIVKILKLWSLFG